MTEKKIGNPFDEDNFASGGGLWDGKTVTILTAKATIDALKNKDGSAVMNERTHQPAVRHVLQITGIADEEEMERRETYSAGSLVPTADGDGFVKADGQPGVFHKNTEMAKFSSLIRQGGFDIGSLWDSEHERMRLSRLVGARFVFKGEPMLDKDGHPKKNSKGYDVLKFYPVKFIGFKDGVASTAAAGGNGSTSELRDLAVATIVDILGEAGGKVGRGEMVRKVSAKLTGDPRANKVLALVTREDFHKDVPWTRNAEGFTL